MPSLSRYHGNTNSTVALRMVNKSLSELYKAVCVEHQIKLNPDILEVLEKTKVSENFTLKLTGNNRLRHIQRLNDGDALVVSKCLQNNKCVTGLDVRYNNITNEAVKHLVDLLQDKNSALRTLDLMFNNIESDGAEVLANCLQCNCSLLTLRLSGNKIRNRGGMHLASMLQVNNTLQELEMADCDLVSTGFLTLCECEHSQQVAVSLSFFLSLQATQSVIAFSIVLKSNKALRSFDISRPLLFSHQEEWAVRFSEMLAVNSSLVELHLGKMGMTNTGMEKLTEGLRLNRSLRFLDLRCNRVTQDGVRLLAEVLKQNTALEILDLSSNRIEDEGAVYLSEAITWPGCTLRELSVISNNIRTEGLVSLAQALKANATLTHIYIWGNHLEQPVCQAFGELISSGRLSPEQTDVSPYKVDSQVFLAEVFHSLRKRFYSMDTNSSDTCSNSDTSLVNATGMSTDVAGTSPDAPLVPLQSYW
ncbi:leucine-rich repeat-containing protein 34 isoform X2 [Mugil cephalus]|uniref:leucine-rich repeat-containing protein 34 isoform X2 n=1 Tax=Mugil cephalus TaxID=48193 RepID=UPI001FB5A6FE|nr:leucine-rich repeat-containing protein 34 isoform X2 [Mugil cephalus]